MRRSNRQLDRDYHKGLDDEADQEEAEKDDGYNVPANFDPSKD